jgi:hypothetical protein
MLQNLKQSPLYWQVLSEALMRCLHTFGGRGGVGVHPTIVMLHLRNSP